MTINQAKVPENGYYAAGKGSKSLLKYFQLFHEYFINLCARCKKFNA